ncbi:glycosyltransferase family 2 protein [Ekhidna sp.]|uniref:glycosyltransferase family 2 protein n=1 Tax=Ekhidna sp. TaxID=2608089 RepID=UPI003CCC0FC4
MSLVSVCVPIYNGEKYLRESLDSIVNQTYEDLEILIVDDCSTDNSISIVKEYQKSDSRVKIIQNEINQGLVGNWNRCISEFSGEYMKLHFQDDMMELDTIEKMVMLAKGSGVDLVLTDREYKFEHDIKKFYLDELPRLSDHFNESVVIEPEFIANLLLQIGTNMNFMGEPILGLVKKEVFERYGIYDDTLKQICDFEFWLRIAINERIGFIPERLHIFRLHNESQGAKNSRQKEINPSHLDRIHLADKMHNDETYAKFREIAGENYTYKLLHGYVNTYTKRYGKNILSKHIHERFFEYLDPAPLWKRVINVFSRS